MFLAKDLDDKGELPAPYSIEKHNFNPHLLMGDFEYKEGIPQILKTSTGQFVDRQGRRVNSQGWYVLPGLGHLFDKDGRKKFDKR